MTDSTCCTKHCLWKSVRLSLSSAFIPHIFNQCCSTFFPKLKWFPSDATTTSDILSGGKVLRHTHPHTHAQTIAVEILKDFVHATCHSFKRRRNDYFVQSRKKSGVVKVCTMCYLDGPLCDLSFKRRGEVHDHRMYLTCLYLWCSVTSSSSVFAARWSWLCFNHCWALLTTGLLLCVIPTYNSPTIKYVRQI